VVTGGAGYIGSHIVHLFLQKGYHVVVIDHAERQEHLLALPGAENLTLFKADFADGLVLDYIFSTFTIDAVIHCAAYIEVGESVKDPERFYTNNVIKTHALLQKMRLCGVKRCIFSSSCAVYGSPQSDILTEAHPRNPVSPYGMTKYSVERMLEDYRVAYNFQYCALRYFNAAGGTPLYNLAERHEPETHLIPRVLKAAHEKSSFGLYGTDYPTPDGTCIRDYLHVRDLADAHWRACEYLKEGGASCALNLGTGMGFSVKQVCVAVEEQVQTELLIDFYGRRAGDPARLVADATAARELLGWNPVHSSLEQIIKDADRCLYSDVMQEAVSADDIIYLQQ
jgi:UDP-glucose 4-epimerase